MWASRIEAKPWFHNEDLHETVAVWWLTYYHVNVIRWNCKINVDNNNDNRHR